MDKMGDLSVLPGTFRPKKRQTQFVGYWSGRRAAWYASERGGRAGTRRPFFLSLSVSPFPLDRLFSHDLLSVPVEITPRISQGKMVVTGD
jgi:hypothetical protein